MNLERRLRKLEEHATPEETPAEAEKRRKEIQEQAEHANRCGWGEEVGRWPLFEIDEDGNVSCTHDDKPVTGSRQILAESFYWMEVKWGGPGLVHEEAAQAFYTPSGELALSRDRVDLRNLMGPGREEGLRGGGVIPIG